MFIGYIQNNEDKVEQTRQYQEIQSFAKEHGFKLDYICADYAFADIKEMIHSTHQGVIIYNILSLGNGLGQIKDNLLFCREHKLQVYSVENNYRFNSSNMTDDFFNGIDIAMDVRSSLVSQNVKKILKKRKNEGGKLGRPVGDIIKRRLSGKEAEIRTLLSNHVSKAEIARRFNVTRNTVFRFVKKNGLEDQESINA